MGGRGADRYSPPPRGGEGGEGGGNNFSKNALMPLLPNGGREALGEKGRPMSIQKAYHRANPFYSPVYDDFSKNCQRSVVAYEMRRRGYDVTAQPTFENDRLPAVRYTGKNGELRQGAWTSAFRSARPVSVGARQTKDVYDNVKAQMKDWGHGSRAVVSVSWGGGDGHVFVVENQNGRMVYVDPQTSRIYSPNNVFKYAVSNSVTLTRVDNLRVSGKIDRFVWREGTGRRR